jgi:hypothetical protein
MDDATPAADRPPGPGTPRAPSRRGFLIGGGLAVAAAAGGGVAVGLSRSMPRPAAPPEPPAALLAALAAEHALIAGIDLAAASATAGPATAGSDDRQAGLLRQVRADHVAHARALQAAVTQAHGGLPPSSSPAAGSASGSASQDAAGRSAPSVPGSPQPGTPGAPASGTAAIVPSGSSTPTAGTLRAAEQRAAIAAASSAARLSGRDASLLASIAACEAGHAELLS